MPPSPSSSSSSGYTIKLELACSGLQIDDLFGDSKVEFIDTFANALDLDPVQVIITRTTGWDNVLVTVEIFGLRDHGRAVQLLHVIGEHRTRWWWWYSLVPSATESGTVILRSLDLRQVADPAEDRPPVAPAAEARVASPASEAAPGASAAGEDRRVPDLEEAGPFEYKITPALAKVMVLTSSPARPGQNGSSPSGARLERGASFTVKRRLTFLNDRDDGGKQVRLCTARCLPCFDRVKLGSALTGVCFRFSRFTSNSLTDKGGQPRTISERELS